jgi:uncharacterized OB-fold protein
MFTQTARRQRSPTPSCRRCGTALYEHVAFCPYCGIDHPLAASGEIAAAAQASVASATMQPAQHAALIAAAPAAPANTPYADALASLESPGAMPRGKSRWGFMRAAMIVTALTLVYVSLLLLTGNRPDRASDTADVARTASGSITPSTPGASSSGTATSATTSTANAPQASADSARQAPRFANLVESLRAARASLATNNLSDARIALDAAAAMEPKREDVRQFQRDLAAIEVRRDAALRSARQCEQNRMWPCVRQYANTALSIDSGSNDAKALLQHAIVASAWTALPQQQASRAPARAAAQAAHTSRAPRKEAATTDSTTNTASPPDTSEIDAQQRAIVESGWKHPPNNAAPAQ